MKYRYLLTVLMTVLTSNALPARESDQAVVETFKQSVNASGDLLVNQLGWLYATDFGNTLDGGGQQVLRLTQENFQDVFASGLSSPASIGFNEPFYYVVESDANAISLFWPNGQSASRIESTGLADPKDIAFTFIEQGDGSVTRALYATNCSDNTIRVMNFSDETSTVYASSDLFSCPYGLIRRQDQGSDILYVSNFNNGNILKVTPDKQVSVLATLPGNGNGFMTYADGGLYVAARTANQIWHVQTDGIVRLIAGTGESGNDNGPALEASFNQPNGIAYSGSERLLYVNSVAQSNGALNPVHLRQIRLQPKPEPTDGVINIGMGGTWANPNQTAQGMMLDVIPERKQIFLTWMKYRSWRPEDADSTPGLPGADHRWWTAQGTYDDDTAILNVYETGGGQFDTDTPVISEPIAQIWLSFQNCTEADLTYLQDGNDAVTVQTLKRLTPATLCKEVNAGWTEWLNRDHPSGTGDWEERYLFGTVCETPSSYEARTADTHIPADSTGEIFHLNSPSAGLVCRNADQPDGYCMDYEVRFYCD